MALLKYFKMPWSERQRLKFRAETFNVFNHPSFNNPSVERYRDHPKGRSLFIGSSGSVFNGFMVWDELLPDRDRPLLIRGLNFLQHRSRCDSMLSLVL